MGPGLDLTIHAGEPVILLRLLIATLAGAAVGWNRYRAGKPPRLEHQLPAKTLEGPAHPMG